MSGYTRYPASGGGGGSSTPVLGHFDTSTSATGSNALIKFTNVVEDSNSGYSTSTGLYTIQTGEGGFYDVFAALTLNTGGAFAAVLKLYKNGSLYKLMNDIFDISSGFIFGAIGNVPCNDGDTLSIIINTSLSTNCDGSNLSYFTVAKR